MDAVELGRRCAAELHMAAVARGLDPTKPYAFAVGEALHRGLDVEMANPGAAILDNGRATLLPDQNLIIHENAGSDFERAFLVSHEIGHHELGDGVSPTTTQVNMAQIAEPPPTGIDRVMDYGRRQRREVQMDLFAREFLMPRAWVRQLHLEKGMSASAIADLLNAPFDVVAQQLFDALFLPVIEPEVKDGKDYPLNPAQSDAAKHRGKAYLLEAGPGTGKTQTLTERVVQLLDERVDPRRILVLTYSNKAANEMAERIAVKKPEHAAAMWIGTFHAFGLDLIRRFSTEFDLSDNPRMMDRVEAVELLEAEFPKLALECYRDLYDPTRIIGDILAAISRAKDEVVGPDEYARCAAEMLKNAAGVEPRHTRALESAEVARVYNTYEALKRAHKAIDFGDLVALPAELFERRPDIAKQLQELYDHVLVDEFQDVNHASIQLLKALCPTGHNLWVVGDARQSIYRFRGAAPASMAKFSTEDFPDSDGCRLEVNYRSSEEIVTAYSTFAQKMTASTSNALLKADRGPNGNPIELRLVSDKDSMSVAIADAISERHSDGIAYRDQAVLCTGNEKLGELARALERMGIPVLFLGSLFERNEIKDLLSLLSLLADRRAMGLVRVGCMPDFVLTLGDVSAILDLLREEPKEPLSWLTARSSLLISEEARASLDRLATALAGFDADSSPWHVLATLLLDRTGIAANIATANSIAERSQGIALWQLLNFLRVQPVAHGKAVPRLLDRIRRLVAIGDDRDLRQLPAAAQGLDAVRLMTIHGAKGLEFNCVHLPGLNQDTLPSYAKAPSCLPPEGIIRGLTGDVRDALRDGDAEERECLFYVATSRARDRLFLYAVTQRTDGANRPLSEFLPRLGAAVLRVSPSLTRSSGVEPEAEPISLRIEGPLRFRESQIAMLDSTKCSRRFFYTHVLGVGGRRTETPYMKMHEAARSVIRAATQDGLDIANDQDLRSAIEKACDERGLDLAGGFAELRTAAYHLVAYFRASRANHTPEELKSLSLTVGKDLITFSPDDVLRSSSGKKIYRRIRTGAYRESDTKDLGVATALLAVAENASGAMAEIVHLTTGKITSLSLSALVLGRRRNALQTVMDNIRAGQFPADPSQRVCPSCPAFFICGRVPNGTLNRKFE